MTEYERIEGWFGEMEAQFYRHQVQRAVDEARFVEIGSWKGRSSYCMAEAISHSGKRIDFWCVDTWRGSEEHQEIPEVQGDVLYDEFLSNIHPVSQYIQPLRMTSREAASRFADASLDFVFIDAAHDFDSVLSDIQTWRPKVKPEGILAGHDYRVAWPGVVQAVEVAFAGQVMNFGPCWYFSERNRQPAPFTCRAFCKRLNWGLRRLIMPGLFTRRAA